MAACSAAQSYLTLLWPKGLQPEGNGTPLQYSCLEKSHGRRSLVGCSPWGREESDTTERLHFNFSLSCIGGGSGNPLQCSCLENLRDGGAWWAAVYGVAQSRTRLKRLSSSSSRLLCPWDFPSKNTGVSHHFLLQRIFQTQGTKLCLLLSPALAGGFFSLSFFLSPALPGKPICWIPTISKLQRTEQRWIRHSSALRSLFTP